MANKGGRPRKPTQLHIINGNPSKIKDLEKRAEPKPKPIMPKPPHWMDYYAKKEWDRVAPELERLGLLTIVDGAALENHCQNYAGWVRCQLIIKENGMTYEYTNKHGDTNVIARPEVRMAQAYSKLIQAFCGEFGLTPSSRSRMTLPGKDEEDEFDRLLGKM